LAEELVIKGSTTVYPIIERIARHYQRSNAEIKISVSAQGSNTGIKALLEQTADIASSSRYLKTSEIEQAAAQGISLVPFQIAYDCILPIVHHSNPLKDISSQQLKAIYSGKIRNWKDLGGKDLAIKAISRVPSSGTFGVWDVMIMQGEEINVTEAMQITTDEVVHAVSKSPAAIGYISLGYLAASTRFKPLKVNGVFGSLKTARDGTYLLNRPLFLFTRGWPKGRIREFIHYVQHPDTGQSLVGEAGYIPLI
jgi:phosphate transport system substrate-binding protein